MVTRAASIDALRSAVEISDFSGVGEVETDGLGKKGLERHLVDGACPRSRIEMARSIDVGSSMIAQRERHGGGGELVAVGHTKLIVGRVGSDDDRGICEAGELSNDVGYPLHAVRCCSFPSDAAGQSRKLK
jgi:hypothetical protein